MNKIVLSTITALAISATSASAMNFYEDKNGQVFTSNAEDRTLVQHTKVEAKASKLKFSGVHYFGLTTKKLAEDNLDTQNEDESKTKTNFELRRNYLQVKAYLLSDQKSFFRVTLDTVYDAKHDDHADIYAKYAYLYIDEFMPNTGLEFGMAHRPWIDYEEHQSWYMRSISKVFAEASEAGHLTNSADLGFNLKTKTPYFTSELGIFNGEGYHGKNEYDQDSNTSDEYIKDHMGDGLSAEWRLTAAFSGNGTKKRKATKDSYFDASFFGQVNTKSSKNEGKDYTIMGYHTVYNMPSFLISAQYITSQSDLADSTDFNGKGYSLNTTFRFGEKKQGSILARYDFWENENSTTSEVKSTEKNIIAGFAFQQNKNVKWLLTYQGYDVKESDSKDYQSFLLTTEVHW